MPDLDVRALRIPDIKVITARKWNDHRGWLSETFSRRAFAEAGLPFDFFQDNQSFSIEPGTVRGLHYQTTPWAQDKLIRVLSGRIYDVVVDIRRASTTFLQWISYELSADNGHQIFVPAGFAHGFCTLEPSTQVLYKVTNFYAPDHERGIRWNDPELAIDWPINEDRAIISEKDAVLPLVRHVKSWF